MRKKFCLVSLLCLILTGCFNNVAAQSKRIYSNSQLSFQYGFSVKGSVEFGLNSKSQKPVFRLCTDFGIGSNVLARALYFSINTELQLYNGGLGSKRRGENKKPGVTLDIINAFTLTTGLRNYLIHDSLPHIINTDRNVPLYYFSNFSYPALQNPYSYSISAGTNFIFSTDKYKSSQRVGFLNVHLHTIQISYYNDGGTPLEQTYLGDGKDRFYSGGALISYHGISNNGINLVEISFNRFTGYTKNAFEVSNKLDLAFVNYNNTEEKYYNKSLWSFNIGNPEKGFGITL
ncbi:MAG TPA: polymorphic toxin type 23 domain-containing protein, partial [Ginsengibacter sp.]